MSDWVPRITDQEYLEFLENMLDTTENLADAAKDRLQDFIIEYRQKLGLPLRVA
jgi:hypothetical protein